MSERDTPVVELSQVSFSRGAKKIFNEISLRLERGLVTAIMGPSGTGKTTLLNIIGAQLKPDDGDVRIDGQSNIGLSRNELYQLRRRMGMLFQQGALFTDLNVFENVAFILREHTNLSNDMIRDLVLMKLQAVGLRGAAYMDTSQLSGGMARRVALARAIMLDPEIMMYDEPFTGQDPIGRGVLLKLIRELNDTLKMTTIMVSHDVKETLMIADRVCVLSEGKVLGYGSPEQLLQSADPGLHQFINGLPDGTVPFHYPAQDYAKELELC
ncbi:MAG: ABC transporter ATP-binding protein [Coxiellaceae bacterium]|nr:ABC transporter ATP-binding protein [Coxiellaceae bacterium]